MTNIPNTPNTPNTPSKNACVRPSNIKKGLAEAGYNLTFYGKRNTIFDSIKNIEIVIGNLLLVICDDIKNLNKYISNSNSNAFRKIIKIDNKLPIERINSYNKVTNVVDIISKMSLVDIDNLVKLFNGVKYIIIVNMFQNKSKINIDQDIFIGNIIRNIDRFSYKLPKTKDETKKDKMKHLVELEQSFLNFKNVIDTNKKIIDMAFQDIKALKKGSLYTKNNTNIVKNKDKVTQLTQQLVKKIADLKKYINDYPKIDIIKIVNNITDIYQTFINIKIKNEEIRLSSKPT